MVGAEQHELEANQSSAPSTEILNATEPIPTVTDQGKSCVVAGQEARSRPQGRDVRRGCMIRPWKGPLPRPKATTITLAAFMQSLATGSADSRDHPGDSKFERRRGTVSDLIGANRAGKKLRTRVDLSERTPPGPTVRASCGASLNT